MPGFLEIAQETLCPVIQVQHILKVFCNVDDQNIIFFRCDHINQLSGDSSALENIFSDRVWPLMRIAISSMINKS